MATIQSEGYFVIRYEILQRLERDLSVDDLIAYIEETRKKIKAATGSMWDNGRLMISNIFGHPFSASLIKTSPNRVNNTTYYTLNVWDVRGIASVGGVSFDLGKNGYAPAGTFKDVCARMDDYTRGIIHCSHCGDPMDIREAGGSYFAATYCQECWTTKPNPDRPYKKIEAEETYN